MEPRSRTESKCKTIDLQEGQRLVLASSEVSKNTASCPYGHGSRSKHGFICVLGHNLVRSHGSGTLGKFCEKPPISAERYDKF